MYNSQSTQEILLDPIKLTFEEAIKNNHPEYLGFLMVKANLDLQEKKTNEYNQFYLKAQEVIFGIISITSRRKIYMEDALKGHLTFEQLKHKANTVALEEYLDECVDSNMNEGEGKDLKSQLEKNKNKKKNKEAIKAKLSTLRMIKALDDVQRFICSQEENTRSYEQIVRINRITKLIVLLNKYHDEKFLLKLPSIKIENSPKLQLLKEALVDDENHRDQLCLLSKQLEQITKIAKGLWGFLVERIAEVTGNYQIIDAKFNNDNEIACNDFVAQLPSSNYSTEQKEEIKNNLLQANLSPLTVCPDTNKFLFVALFEKCYQLKDQPELYAKAKWMIEMMVREPDQAKELSHYFQTVDVTQVDFSLIKFSSEAYAGADNNSIFKNFQREEKGQIQDVPIKAHFVQGPLSHFAEENRGNSPSDNEGPNDSISKTPPAVPIKVPQELDIIVTSEVDSHGEKHDQRSYYT